MKKLIVLFCAFFMICLLSKGGFAMEITSPEFKHKEMIPQKFTCQGADASPALEISGVPKGTVSLALIVDDPDAPVGNWDHWIVYNIPPQTARIEENSIPGEQVLNDFGRKDWGGPCPPSGTHRYFFKLYALDVKLSLSNDARKKDLEVAMQGHILEKSELIGLYKKF